MTTAPRLIARDGTRLESTAETRPGLSGSTDEARLAWLADQIAHNRFLPIPPAELHTIGDGDFRAIAAEFLTLFVRVGGLLQDDAVLDIGCGVGRMAIALTQFLCPERGSYAGIDIAKPAIDWCLASITAAYPRFHFRHLDRHHPLYNPAGMKGGRLHLPYDDGAFNFIVLTSVVTHLQSDELKAYAAEIRRLLRPGGRCFLTAFLVDAPARASLKAGRGKLPFRPDLQQGQPARTEYHAYPTHPTAAVAYEETWFEAAFAAAGLRLARPILAGHWSGRTGETFQDVCVFETDPGL